MTLSKRILSRRRALVAPGAGAAVFALAACGGGGDPLADSSASPGDGGGGTVIVGSANFTESQVLGELYAQAMKAKGVDVQTKPGIGSREVYIKALQDNSISMIPEYTGNLLLYFDPQATATTEDEIMAALPAGRRSRPEGGEPSKAQDQDVYVVTKQTSEQSGITSLEDLEEDLRELGPRRTVGAPGAGVRAARAGEDLRRDVQAVQAVRLAGGQGQGPERQQDPGRRASSPPTRRSRTTGT